jgi:hypothetical protein
LSRIDELEREVRRVRSDRLWLAVVVACLGALLLISNISYRKRKQARAILDDRVEEYVSDRSKRPLLVDIGVCLKVVTADPSGEELIDGMPKMRVVKESEHGGVLNTKTGKIVRLSSNPIVWYCSEDQYPIILHGDLEAVGIMAYGSEGAGKTALLPRWHYMRWLENIGENREGGQTAPTKRRLKMFEDAFFGVFHRQWITKFRRSAGQITLVDGTRIQLMQTHQQSRAGGSPIQGYNWSWCGSDEFQDSFERSDDIDARGRSARLGIYKQLRTCTAKDTNAWREFKQLLLSRRAVNTNEPLWNLRKILGRKSPFVAVSHWDLLKAKLSPREYNRRVEPLEDLAPDLAVYYGFSRDGIRPNLETRHPGRLANLDRINPQNPSPYLDVTTAVLAGYQSYLYPGRQLGLLVAHDPGNIFNTSVVLKLLIIHRGRELVPTWVVVGELQTRQTTQRQHAKILVEYLRRNFFVRHPTVNGPLPLCFIDPHGRGENQTDYDSTYIAFQAEGLDCFNPATSDTGRINRRPRVEMVNRLLGGSAEMPGMPRLIVAVIDDGSMVTLDETCSVVSWRPMRRGETVAPKLVEAFETMMKNPGDDDPEGTRRKNEDDKTHAPAALGYGLWCFEQEAFTVNTVRVALAAARGARAA